MAAEWLVPLIQPAYLFFAVVAVLGMTAIASMLQRWTAIEAAVFAVICLVGAYCLIGGLALSVGWVNPLAGASAEALADVSGRSRGRGGMVLLIIQYWPWVAAGFGAWTVYYTRWGVTETAAELWKRLRERLPD